MSRTKTVLFSLVCNYLYTGVTIACSLLIVPIAIQHLGKVGYGKWVGLTALTALAAFSDMGVAGALLVRLSKAIERGHVREAGGELISGLTVSGLSALIGGAIVGTTVAAADVFLPGSFSDPRLNLAIAATLALSVALSQASGGLAALPTAQLRPFVASLTFMVANVAGTAASVVLVGGYGLLGLALGQLVRSSATFLPLAAYNLAHMLQSGMPRRPQASLCGSYLAPGFTGLAVRWLQGILGSADVVCVTSAQGPASAAVFASTARPMSMATGLAASFGSALLPSYTRLVARDAGPVAFSLFVSTLRLTVIAAGALAVGFVCVSRPFVRAWIGPEYIVSPQLTIAIACAAVSTVAIGFTSFLFGATGKIALANVVLCIEGVSRLALMACGARLSGGLGVAVGATPTPLIATAAFVALMAGFSGVERGRPPWLAVAGDLLLVWAFLAAASLLPDLPLAIWQIPLVAALGAAVVAAVLVARSAPLRDLVWVSIQSVRLRHGS